VLFRSDLGEHVALAVDGGDPAHLDAPPANTIVDLTFDRPFLVRPGAVSTARVREFLPNLDADVEAYQRRFAARAADPYLAHAS
jgi:L-threonylcarbamoyladenylate synthase